MVYEDRNEGAGPNVRIFDKKKRQKRTVSPGLTGKWLAGKLDERCTIENITDDQRGLAEQVRLPLIKLFDEIVILSAFSVDFAILSLLHGSPYQDEVRQGFMGGVRGWPAEECEQVDADPVWPS